MVTIIIIVISISKSNNNSNDKSFIINLKSAHANYFLFSEMLITIIILSVVVLAGMFLNGTELLF